MRINKHIAQSTGLSRRAADAAISEGRINVNGNPPETGYNVLPSDIVTLDGAVITVNANIQTIMFNKPFGYICSRDGQGSETIYDILPAQFHQLKPVGRLDRDSSGLLLLTNDGNLAHQLTHPSFQKTKIYEVTLNKPLEPLHRQIIGERGVMLEDGGSKLQLDRLNDGDDQGWQVTMHEGRNRQIRRTFGSLGYTVRKLHRTHFGNYALNDLVLGEVRLLPQDQMDQSRQ